jgi:hypothetical protein
MDGGSFDRTDPLPFAADRLLLIGEADDLPLVLAGGVGQLAQQQPHPTTPECRQGEQGQQAAAVQQGHLGGRAQQPAQHGSTGRGGRTGDSQAHHQLAPAQTPQLDQGERSEQPAEAEIDRHQHHQQGQLILKEAIPLPVDPGRQQADAEGIESRGQGQPAAVTEPVH